ncbi:hypothetical protein ACROYT_G014311 [Oculina patagonica]
MAHTCVKVKHGEKVLKLRPTTLTVANLALVFKLEPERGINIYSEEKGEIILPSENGSFEVEECWKTYIFSGETAVIPPANYSYPSQFPSTSLGIPISYQPPRGKSNPPPGNFERPTFKAVKASQGWKKSFVVVEIASSGNVFDKYQEETASEEAITEMLKQQLGVDVCILDSKHLPIMAGETTTGYVNDLKECVVRILQGTESLVLERAAAPRSLLSDFDRPDKQAALDVLKSRFKK